MAKKPTSPAEPTSDQTTVGVTVYPPATPPVVNPLDDILRSYNLPANVLCVEVLRSHGRLYEGQVVYLPNNDQTAGLINGGYVQLVPPPILGVETYQ